MLSDILDMFTDLQNDTEEYLDICDAIVNEDIVLAIDSLLVEVTLNHVINPWLNTMRQNYSAGSSVIDITDTDYNYALFKTHADEKYNRPFLLASAELTVFATTELFKGYNDVYNQTLWMAIERCSLDNANRHLLFNKLVSGADLSYCVIYNKKELNIPRGKNIVESELYAYALAKNLNLGNAINMPTLLSYSFVPPFSSAFSYDSNVIYKQYYDIYDVLDEWIRSDNLLEAFLKMYQITEYIVFRHEFKLIIDRSSLKQSFLQQIKKLNQRDGERATYIRVFQTLFDGFAVTCQPLLANAGGTLGAEDFIKDYLSKDKRQSYLRNVGQSAVDFDKEIPQFIYDMRCCIVHNKEAEFHVTPHNVSVYKPILPLMKEILNLMGGKIVSLVNNPTSSIKYDTDSLALY